MQSFPRVTGLPPVLSTRGWQWELISRDGHPADGFWLGTDAEGNRWLTKLRGSWYAYREISFAKLAQSMGWCCQSSTYLKLDPESAVRIGGNAGDVHAAHWYLHEHDANLCSATCALTPLAGLDVRSVDDLKGIQVAHLFDWPKSEFAAYIFGANEPSGRLFTTQHEFVIIDNEQMFSTGPADFSTAHWLNRLGGTAYAMGLAVALETCAEVANLSEESVRLALAVPQGVKIDRRWPIEPMLKQSIRFAAEYRDAHAGV